jgi:hypothetical protein
MELAVPEGETHPYVRRTSACVPDDLVHDGFYCRAERGRSKQAADDGANKELEGHGGTGRISRQADDPSSLEYTEQEWLARSHANPPELDLPRSGQNILDVIVVSYRSTARGQ